MWKLELICEAALVSIVPLIWTTNVMKQDRSVVRHFLERGQLKGLAGSLGVVQSSKVTSCSGFGTGEMGWEFWEGVMGVGGLDEWLESSL